jgi:hypothetical protein
MLMKQVELQQDDGSTIIAWIDQEHSIVGNRVDLNLGNGKRSPVMTIRAVWNTVRDLTEIQERDANRRAFGGSIR